LKCGRDSADDRIKHFYVDQIVAQG